MKKTCIIVTGPTAVGKTAIALSLARHFNTHIISADSRQCYKELNIAVAKPRQSELDEILHYFINSHSIQDYISAADFEEYALAAVEEIFKKNDIAIMVGGTGLYINAFCHGLDPIPQTDIGTREKIISSFESMGIEWLQEEVMKQDPAFYASGEINNPQRLMRALEVIQSTGKSITSFQSKQKLQRPFNIIKIGLDMPRNELYQRINNRADDMMKLGLEAEARALLPFRNLNALQTVGYRELFSYFDGEISLERAIELIKQNSRHYAKRQLTWFKKDEDIAWLAPDESVVHNYAITNLKI